MLVWQTASSWGTLETPGLKLVPVQGVHQVKAKFDLSLPHSVLGATPSSWSG